MNQRSYTIDYDLNMMIEIIKKEKDRPYSLSANKRTVQCFNKISTRS